jgi:hypothetical protein
VALGIDETASEEPPTAEPRSETVDLTGSRDGHDWTARFSGAFDDASACIRVTVAGAQGSNGPSCRRSDLETSWAGAQASLDLWMFDELAVAAGSVPVEVDAVRFRSDDATRPVVEGECTTGPVGWTDHDVCAVALPSEDAGTFEYLNADGAAVGADGMGWGAEEAAPATPANVAPVHGGRYWAVYAWAGLPGDPEADQISAQLADAFGIEASPGELGCDQGAAKALGMNDRDHGIAVYFDTREDAVAFAHQLFDAGVPTEAPIVQVTTFCVD